MCIRMLVGKYWRLGSPGCSPKRTESDNLHRQSGKKGPKSSGKSGSKMGILFSVAVSGQQNGPLKRAPANLSAQLRVKSAPSAFECTPDSGINAKCSLIIPCVAKLLQIDLNYFGIIHGVTDRDFTDLGINHGVTDTDSAIVVP